MVFPRLCPACCSPVPVFSDHPLCPKCMKNILRVHDPVCTRCGAPFESKSSIPHLCSKCIEKPGHVDWTRSLFLYKKPVASLIKGLKYKGDRSCLKALKKLSQPILEKILNDAPLAQYTLNKKSTCVVPVPLHINRLKKRMFNQSLLIAKGLFPNMPIETSIVRRVLDNPPQSGLSRKERVKNVRNIFEAGSLRGFRHFIIVDDVITTGSTIGEMAKILKKKGAKKILAISIARAS